MSDTKHNIKLIGLNGNLPLAEKTAEVLGFPLIKTSIKHFSDGEINININETVRGDNVYVIQSIQDPVNENLMELLIIIDALRRASAHKINVVVPYMAYARADRKTKAREPITAKLVANMIEEAGADRVIALDLHASQIQGFFDIPVDHLRAVSILAKFFLDEGVKENVVIVSPDHSGTNMARKFAEFFDAPIAIVDQRGSHYDDAVHGIIGEVEGATAIIVDDIIDTGIRLSYSTKSLKAAGAKKVYAAATHALLSKNATEILDNAGLEQIVVTDSIIHEDGHYPENMVRLSVDYLLAAAIQHIYENKSLHDIFDDNQNLIMDL